MPKFGKNQQDAVDNMNKAFGVRSPASVAPQVPDNSPGLFETIMNAITPDPTTAPPPPDDDTNLRHTATKFFNSAQKR